MKLHVFNPEHDIALAVNKAFFTPPHAGRQLRADLGFIPALWADNADLVLVDDVETAEEAVRHVKKFAHAVQFVSKDDLRKLDFSSFSDFKVEPWGWDSAIRHQLVKANESLEAVIPSELSIAAMRKMSNRRFAAEKVLPRLCALDDRLVGESRYCATIDVALDCLQKNCGVVLKSPWSSSGRGVRYVESSTATEHQMGWMKNVIAQQGSIMVEPRYNKVLDFGMEFRAGDDGTVEYCGLSLFETRNGAYVGSVLATEADKRDMLSQYVDMDLLDGVKENLQAVLCSEMAGIYTGAFGVDMMAVAKNNGSGFLLHPCVELNLRRTMGHVALALTPTPFEPQRLMSIYYADKYRMRIQTLTDNLLNTEVV